MLPLLLTLAIVALTPQPDVVEDRVDVVEVNDYWACLGWDDPKPVKQFTQAIFWQGGAVRDWRLDKGQFTIHADHVTWIENNVLYRVRFGFLRRTVTDTDPELDDRTEHPQSQRVKIGGAK